MIRMLLFTVAVLVTFMVIFPGENFPEKNRAAYYRDLVENQQLDAMIHRLRNEVAMEQGDQAMRRQLVELMLHSENPDWRKELTLNARQVLRNHDDLEWFAQFLKSDNRLVQENAIRVCQDLRLVQMMPLLKKLAYEPGEEVRAAATVAVSELKPQECEFLLRLACHDGAPEVRQSAAPGLAKLGGQADLRRLIRLLGDNAEEVRQAARESLVQACHAQNTQLFVKLRREQEGELAQLATIALASQGDSECLNALPSLVTAASGNEDILRLLARVLAVQRPDVLERLLEKLSLESGMEEVYSILSQEQSKTSMDQQFSGHLAY